MLFLRFIRELFLPKRPTGPGTLRRWAILFLFVPLFFLVQGFHWFCFLLDELFFAGYRKIQIREPLFVVGLPRSGTSFLQRVLAGDRERFTTTRLWELLLAPSITQRKILLGLGALDRGLGSPVARVLARVERGSFGWLDAIHQLSLSEPEEDYFLLLPVFACFLMVVPFPYQNSIWELARFDELPQEKRAPVMAFYRRAVQRHLYVAGPEKQLLSKNPSFTPFVASLIQEFPDARFLCCVRNPVEVVPSLLSSIRSGAEAFGYDVGNPRIRDRFVDMLEFFSRHAPQTLSTLPADRWAFAPLPEVKGDLEGFVLSLYRRFGWEADGQFRERLMGDSSRGRAYRSRHQYTLEEFGLSPESVELRFREFSERFHFGSGVPG